MPFEAIEKLEAKIKLVVKEVHRLQKENKRYSLKTKEVQEQKKSLEAELEKYRKQTAQLTKLEAFNKKLEDEKILVQSKVSDILNDLDKLEFL